MDGVVLLGNPPMYHTGYGSQLRLLGQSLLSQGFSVAHVCDYGYSGHMFTLDGVDVYGCDELPGVLKDVTLKNHIRDWRKRHMIENWCLIGLGNVWKWGEITQDIHNSLLMVPVEGDELDSSTMSALSSTRALAGISAHGVEVLSKHVEGAHLLPHGYDPRLVTASGRGQRAIRATATFQLASSCFLVGFLGDSTVRKCPEENIEAFMRFAEGKTDVRLWVKGSNHSQAVDIDSMLGMLPPGVVLGTSTYDSHRGLDSKEMAELLCSLDVLLHCSSQEGFGIFQIEAQALGTPVINTGFGPMPELNAHPDLVVPISGARTVAGVNYGVPDIDGIVVRLEELYSEWKDGSISRRRVTCTSWSESYSFESVFKEYYLPVVRGLLDEGHVNSDQPSLSVRKPRALRRVAFLSTYDVQCGIATYTKMLAEELVGAVEVVILAEATEEHPIGDSDLEGPVKVVRCWDRRFDAGAALRDALARFAPDVVHVQHEWALFARARDLWDALRESDVRTVITYHTPDFVEQHEQAWSHLFVHGSFTDGIIVHNGFIARSIRGRVFPPVCHIHHGVVQLPSLPDARDVTNIPEGVPMLLNYGFASESKGTLDLIRAVDIVRRRGRCPYFEVVIYAGDHPHWEMDPYLQKCEGEAESVAGLTFIREFIDDDNLDLMLNATDFLVYPYSGVPGHEILSTSGAVMRGLGCGKPVICTDEGRLRDVVGGVHGFKASMRNPESLADAVEAAVNMFHSNKAEYHALCDKVTELASSRSWPLVVERHLQVYAKVCAAWCIRPDRVMPVRPVWIQNNAKGMLEYDDSWSSDSEVGKGSSGPHEEE
jgi:glycosyltransferase involved in cell wall biosynthesis